LAQANLTSAMIDVERTTIYAPLAGRVGVTSVSVGNVVGPESPALTRIVRLDPIRIVFSINQRDLVAAKMTSGLVDQAQLNATFKPRLVLQDGRILDRDGHIYFINNEVDSKTGTVSVRALFGNPDALLLPGQYVTVMVRPVAADMRPVVPAGAVIRDGEGTAVMMIGADNKAERRGVEVGRLVAQAYPVLKGLAGGETIIVDGLAGVRPGQPVRRAEPGANAATVKIGAK
jgi:membrane fusion protein, multidrug efflux system